MRPIFLVFGYGVPENIHTDTNLRSYMNQVFNRIYDIAIENPEEGTHTYFCGGPSALKGDLSRTEAYAMERFFGELMARRPVLRLTRTWITERVETERCLSTLGNMVAVKERVGDAAVKKLFCEHTRRPRIARLASTLLKLDIDYTVGIDFDESAQRFDARAISQRERILELAERAALKNPVALHNYYQLFADRLDGLRTAPDERARKEVLKGHLEELHRLSVTD